MTLFYDIAESQETTLTLLKARREVHILQELSLMMRRLCYWQFKVICIPLFSRVHSVPIKTKPKLSVREEVQSSFVVVFVLDVNNTTRVGEDSSVFSFLLVVLLHQFQLKTKRLCGNQTQGCGFLGHPGV